MVTFYDLNHQISEAPWQRIEPVGKTLLNDFSLLCGSCGCGSGWWIPQLSGLAWLAGQLLAATSLTIHLSLQQAAAKVADF